MNKKKLQTEYSEKINLINKFNKFYYDDNKPKVTDQKYDKLKILGSGDIKNKVNLSVNFISKQAREKIEKIGGKLTLIKN